MYKRSWENEIEKDREDKRNSIAWALGEGRIEKSESSEIITKAGADVMWALLLMKSKEDTELSKLLDEANGLIKSIGFEPESDQKYSYSQIYKDDTEIQKSEGNSGMMREYNRVIPKIEVRHKASKFMGELISKFDEEKEYKFSKRMAEELGL